MKKLIGYQVVDKKRAELHHQMDASFCVYSRKQAFTMITESLADNDPNSYSLLPIFEGEIEEPTMMFVGDPETATGNEEQEDTISVFKQKLEAFAKAAQELNNAWDFVDGDEKVMKCFSIRWPFQEKLYYLALRDTRSWVKKTLENLSKL